MTKILNGTAGLILICVILAGCAPQARTLKVGLGSSLSAPKFDMSIMNFPSSDPDSSEGDLLGQIRYDDLIFVKTDSSYLAHYQLSILFYSDKEMTENVYSRILDRKVSVAKYSQTQSTRMYDRFKDRVAVRPGKYFIELRLLDLNTDITSSKKFEYDFKNFFKDSLNISSVLLYEAPDSTPVEVVNNTSRPLFADFFVTSKKGTARVPLHIVAKSTQAPTSIDTSYELDQTSRVQHYHLPIKVEGLESAPYILRLSVGAESAETSFSIFRNGSLANPIDFNDKDGPLSYIMTPTEFDSLRDTKREDRERILQSFWLSRSRGDTAVSRALQKEFYKRIEAADEQFGTQVMPGWQTDRGKIYILYGKPDRVDNHLIRLMAGPEANNPPYEVWYYSSLKLRFVFVDEFRNGDYRLAKTGSP